MQRAALSYAKKNIHEYYNNVRFPIDVIKLVRYCVIPFKGLSKGGQTKKSSLNIQKILPHSRTDNGLMKIYWHRIWNLFHQ